MLKAAKGDADNNPVMYYNLQLMYHLGMSKSDIENMTDEDWATHIAILENIRSEEAKHNQSFTR